MLGAIGLGLAGCSPRHPQAEGEADGAGADAGTASATEGSDDASSASDDDGTAGSDSGGGDDCGSFLGCDDLGPSVPQAPCDFTAQDCPPGKKCVVTPAGDERCVDVAPDARGPGEPCSLDVTGPPGTDDCDATSVCQQVKGAGPPECVEFCVGGDCGDDRWCKQFSGPPWAYCYEPCDPLQADACPSDWTCQPQFWSGELLGLGCAPDSGDAAYGAACTVVGTCARGLRCLGKGDFGAACAADRCCSEYCDLDDPSFTCTDPSHVCTPVFDPPNSFIPHVGVCELP